MTNCLAIRAEEWMKQVYGVSVRGCTYNLTPYCKYWKDCAVELNIDWFLSPKLMALFESSKEEIVLLREAIADEREERAKKKLMRKQTKAYTLRKRR